MKRVVLLFALFSAFAFSALLSCTKEQETVEEQQPVQIESCFVEGELIAELSEEMTASIEESGFKSTRAEALNTALEALGVTRVERLYPDAGEWEPRHRAAGLHRWYRIVYNPSEESATKAQLSLQDIDGVVFVEPSRKIRSTAVFNDPYLSEQWNYYNDGSKGSSYEAGADINVCPVWENYTRGSSDVVVAVIDEGVQLDHEDLSDNCIPAGVSGSKCFLYDYTGFTIYPGDHGTHVAGTIAAINDNGIGVCGIAGGDPGHPGARIMSCQILAQDPRSPQRTLQGNSYDALVWAADNGAVIAQNSWGYVYKTAAEAAKGGVGAFGTAVDYFNKYAGCDKDGNQRPDSPMKGGLVIFASGNDGWAHSWPAEYDGILAVGAMNSRMEKAYYSNYGDWVDICAPGGDMELGPQILSCCAGNSYGSMQGTSMSCPHVSGVAALILSYFGGSGFTREMLWNRLVDGANAETSLSQQKIGPLLDAYGSFSCGSKTAPDKVTDFTSSVKSNAITVNWKVTADEDDIKAYAYLVLLSKNKSDISSVDPKHIPSSVIVKTVQSGLASVGEEISTELQDLDFSTDYWCSIIAFDYSQNYAPQSPVKKIQTQKNNPPVITTDYKGSFKVKPFETLCVTYNISDPDGHTFTVDFNPGSDAAAMTTLSQNLFELSISGWCAPEGKYSASIAVEDKYGASSVTAFSYEILENHPPRVIKNIENFTMGAVAETAVLNPSDYFYDEDGEPLHYTVDMSRNDVASCIISEGAFQISSIGYGIVEITITASDACGKTCSTSFKIAVRDSQIPVLLYPNPVSTELNISTDREMSADIRVVNKAGATVRTVNQSVSPYDPVCIDMKDCAAGTYYVVFKGGSIDHSYTIVKK